jgi:hypothetical protein
MMKNAIRVAIVLLNPKFSLSPDTIGAGGATFTMGTFIFMKMDDTRQSEPANQSVWINKAMVWIGEFCGFLIEGLFIRMRYILHFCNKPTSSEKSRNF